MYGTKLLNDDILTKHPDNAFQIITVGDPNIRLHEIGTPMELVSKFVVFEHVNSYYIERINLKCNLYLLAKGELITHSNG
jgi:DNA-directed RNA polymerase-4 subunit 1